MQPPAESVQDTGQCEDVPPPSATQTLFQTPESVPSSASDLPQSLSVPSSSPDCCSTPDLPQTDEPVAALVLGDPRAEGGTSQGTTTSAPGQAETPMAAVKLESLLDPTELSTVSAERWRSKGRERWGEWSVGGGVSKGTHGSLST